MDTRAPALGALLLAMLAGCASPSMVYDGVYIWGAEVSTFSPCGTDKDWWVLANDSIERQLREAHERLTTMPYEGIFVEVDGSYAGAATAEAGGGFATQYDGLFRIANVRALRKRDAASCNLPH